MSTSRIVGAKEFCELLISRRRLERVRGFPPRLCDPATGTLFVLDERDVGSTRVSR